MGVRTTVWGPHAWRLFHAVCDRLARDDPRGKRFFKLLPAVLPCIYCRRSFGEFYPRLAPLVQKRGYRFFCWRAHGRVSLKLQTQDWEAGKDTSKWDGFTPKWEDLPGYDLENVQTDLAYFLYYVHLDWDRERADDIVEWIGVVASILASEVSWGEAWYRTWYEHAERYEQARNTKQRFEVLQMLVDASGKRPNRVKYTLHKCRRNVVGCGDSGKTNQGPQHHRQQS